MNTSGRKEIRVIITGTIPIGHFRAIEKFANETTNGKMSAALRHIVGEWVAQRETQAGTQVASPETEAPQ